MALVAGCGDDGDDGALEVGDCFDAEGDQRVSVDCDEPHRAQVVGIVGPGPSGVVEVRECVGEALAFLGVLPSFSDAEAEGDAAEGTSLPEDFFAQISEELDLPGLTVQGDLVGDDVTGDEDGAPAFLCYLALGDEGDEQLPQSLEGALEGA